MLRRSRPKTLGTSLIAPAACASLLALTACGGGGGSDSTPSGGGPGPGSTSNYSLGGSISGLGNGTGLVLANGSDTITISAGATSFTLPTALAAGAAYAVTVKTQPTGETCNVSGGSGTMATANVTNVTVSCAVNHYTVGGSITGLAATGLVLVNNGTDATQISTNATQFNMTTAVAAGGAYAISVQTQPTGEKCTVSSAAGTVGSSNVTTVAVSCTTTSAFTTSILYSFGGAAGDGVNPYAGLIQASDGNFYGTTNAGGAHNVGTVFSVTPGGTESVFYSFADGTDGANPQAAPFQASDGNFYGTTYASGSHASGIIYQITPAGVEKILYTFAEGGDGGSSTANLIQATDGNLYGTASHGGLHSVGVLYKVTLAGAESAIYSFAGLGGLDGSFPTTGVIQGTDGSFYGTTPNGGAHTPNGAVYSVTPSGTETVLYSFTGAADGGNPTASLIQASDGNFYGTTQNGGAHNYGTVFKITPSGIETVLYSFAGGADGSHPDANLIEASDGNFYGTTFDGSHFNVGTVFQVTPSGIETVIYAFQGGTDGSHPMAGLIQAKDGNFYGTTRDGGAHANGTVFKVVH